MDNAPGGEPRFGTGAIEATGESPEMLRRRVTAAVSRVCPPWLAQEAEDIVQNVMMQLLRSANDSEGERQFRSMYLQKAAYGATVDEIRRRCRRREGQAREDDNLEGTAATGVADPERETLSDELARGIQDCLLRLVRARRLAVTLYLQGCSVPEAARHLRWTAKKTENLVYRGRADLQRCLRRMGLVP